MTIEQVTIEFHFPLWLVALLLFGALAVGVALTPWARRVFDGTPRGADKATGEAGDGSPDELTFDNPAHDFGSIAAPVVTITALLLSFSLVNVWGSYADAAVKANAEAVAVDYQSDMAHMIPDPVESQELEAVLVCYARSIAGPEWQAMSERGEATAAEVDDWTDRLQEIIGVLGTQKLGTSVVEREIIAADKERATARSQRLTEARVSIPEPITLLLLAAAAVSIIVLAFAYLPLRNRRLHVAALVVVTVMFIGLIQVITELDSPYRGLIDIDATDMARVATDEAADFAEQHPGAQLPCDDQGRLIAN